jgi:hypothetical protein
MTALLAGELPERHGTARAAVSDNQQEAKPCNGMAGATKRDAQSLPGIETRHLMIHRRKTPADTADRFQNGIVIPVTKSEGSIDEYVNRNLLPLDDLFHENSLSGIGTCIMYPRVHGSCVGKAGFHF